MQEGVGKVGGGRGAEGSLGRMVREGRKGEIGTRWVGGEGVSGVSIPLAGEERHLQKQQLTYSVSHPWCY